MKIANACRNSKCVHLQCIFQCSYQSQNAKRASSQKRHMVISIFLLCNSLILMSIGAGSIRAIKGGLDKDSMDQ